MRPDVSRPSAVFPDTYRPPRFGNALMMAMWAHVGLFIWNPMLMPPGTVSPIPPLLQIEYREALPEPVLPPPPPPKPVVEKKKPVPKAKKSGLSLSKKEVPPALRAVKKVTKPVVAPPAPRSRPSMVKMPKFVPRAVDEDVIAADRPMKVAATTGLRPASNPFAAAPLSGKSRGIRASDVNFKLSDRGSIVGGAATVGIPVGEERGEVASVAKPLIEAPRGKRFTSGQYTQAPLGDGVGELAGKDRVGYVGRVRVGMPSEEEVIAAANGRGNGVEKGFEIGGPVGDRKVVRRQVPEYPAWAEEKGITALVKVFFTVRADGSIRRSVRIVHSSGYTELDQLAKEAILAWKFSATRAQSGADDAWGVITFRFTLA